MAHRVFAVRGPFVVPTDGPSRARRVSEARLPGFWDNEVGSWADAKGCYVFALQRGAGAHLPVYVGRTSRTFRFECSTIDKQHKAQKGMWGKAGTLVLFLVVYEQGVGKPNRKAIERLERFLIRLAKEANHELANRVGVASEDFSIRGVYKSGAGKPSAPARKFSRMLRFESK